MTYDFSLDKKSFGFLLGGCALLGILVFVAGLLVGANWSEKPSETVAATSKASAVVSQAEEAAPPKEPVLKKEEAEGEAAHAPADTAKPAKSVDAAPAAEGTKEAQQPAGLKPETQAKIIQTADADAADTTNASEDAAVKKTAFSVQVGVFLEQEQATRFVAEMESKGYTPSVFVANDAENRQWYAVRIGAYADQAEATQAASNFTKQEKIKAIVRPANSL